MADAGSASEHLEAAEGGEGVSRRALMGSLALAGVAAAACSGPGAPGGGNDASAEAPPAFSPLATAQMDAWTAEVGGTFRAGGGYAMKLSGVRPVGPASGRPAEIPRERAFVAVFDLAAGQQMAGDLIYSVITPRRGTFDMFLAAAPTAEFPGRMHALFN